MGFRHRTVGRHLRAFLDKDGVARHQLRRRYPLPLAIAQHLGPRRRQIAQCFEHARRAMALHDRERQHGHDQGKQRRCLPHVADQAVQAARAEQQQEHRLGERVAHGAPPEMAIAACDHIAAVPRLQCRDFGVRESARRARLRRGGGGRHAGCRALRRHDQGSPGWRIAARQCAQPVCATPVARSCRTICRSVPPRRGTSTVFATSARPACATIR